MRGTCDDAVVDARAKACDAACGVGTEGPTEAGGIVKMELVEVGMVEVVVPDKVSSEKVVAGGGCISDTFLCGEGGLDIGGEGYDGTNCHGGDPPFARTRSG